MAEKKSKLADNKIKPTTVIFLLIVIAYVLEFILTQVYLTSYVRHYTNHLMSDLLMVEISILVLWSQKNSNYTNTDEDDPQHRKRVYIKYLYRAFIPTLIIFSAFLAIDSIELYHLSRNSFLERIRQILLLPLVATIVWLEILRRRKKINDVDLQDRKRVLHRAFILTKIIFTAFLVIYSIKLYRLGHNGSGRISDILFLFFIAIIVWIDIPRKRKKPN